MLFFERRCVGRSDLGFRATFANLRLALRNKVPIESWNGCAQSGPKCSQGVNAHSGFNFVMRCFCLGQSVQKCVAVIARVGTLRLTVAMWRQVGPQGNEPKFAFFCH